MAVTHPRPGGRRAACCAGPAGCPGPAPESAGRGQGEGRRATVIAAGLRSGAGRRPVGHGRGEADPGDDDGCSTVSHRPGRPVPHPAARPGTGHRRGAQPAQQPPRRGIWPAQQDRIAPARAPASTAGADRAVPSAGHRGRPPIPPVPEQEVEGAPRRSASARPPPPWPAARLTPPPAWSSPWRASLRPAAESDRMGCCLDDRAGDPAPRAELPFTSRPGGPGPSPASSSFTTAWK